MGKRTLNSPPGAGSGLEWHKGTPGYQNSYSGTVDGAVRFLLDPSVDGDWIMWSVDPRTGHQNGRLGRYITAADAKDAARARVQREAKKC